MTRGTVVLVHGGWGDPNDWRWVREPLEAAGLHVVAVDLPSHRGAEAGLAEDAEAIRKVVRTAEQPVVGVGWSYGTRVLAEAAVHDLPISHLVLVSGIPGTETEKDFTDRSWIDDDPHIETLPDGRFRLDSDWFLDEADGRTFPEDVRAEFRRTGRRWSSRNIERPLTHEDWRKVPATVLYGIDDPLLSPTEKERNAVRFDDVRIIACDHFVPMRAPRTIVDAVREALGR